MNPFLSEFDTPYQIPPFENILPEHILPAVQRGMEEQVAEYEAIEDSPQEPTFANTLIAMESSGRLLKRVLNVFHNLVFNI